MSDLVTPLVTGMVGSSALPRQNGELTFNAPWEGRVLGMAIGLVQHLGLEWEAFRSRLIVAIESHPDRPYYESWTSALESLVADLGLYPAAEHTTTPGGEEPVI